MNVKYQKDGLVITIPTATPAATHAQLLKCITIGFRQFLLNPAELKSENEVLTCLAQVQLALLPDELDLNKALE